MLVSNGEGKEGRAMQPPVEAERMHGASPQILPIQQTSSPPNNTNKCLSSHLIHTHGCRLHMHWRPPCKMPIPGARVSPETPRRGRTPNPIHAAATCQNHQCGEHGRRRQHNTPQLRQETPPSCSSTLPIPIACPPGPRSAW